MMIKWKRPGARANEHTGRKLQCRGSRCTLMTRRIHAMPQGAKFAARASRRAVKARSLATSLDGGWKRVGRQRPSLSRTGAISAASGQICHGAAMDDITELTVILPNDERVTVKGREAWTLQTLISAGAAGVSVIDRPVPRWSCYVHRLRRRGMVIETVREAHGGTYAGRHGRYVLRQPVSVVTAVRARASSHDR